MSVKRLTGDTSTTLIPLLLNQRLFVSVIHCLSVCLSLLKYTELSRCLTASLPHSQSLSASLSQFLIISLSHRLSCLSLTRQCLNTSQSHCFSLSLHSFLTVSASYYLIVLISQCFTASLLLPHCLHTSQLQCFSLLSLIYTSASWRQCSYAGKAETYGELCAHPYGEPCAAPKKSSIDACWCAVTSTSRTSIGPLQKSFRFNRSKEGKRRRGLLSSVCWHLKIADSINCSSVQSIVVNSHRKGWEVALFLKSPTHCFAAIFTV